MVCNGAHAALGDEHVIEISSDQYFLPLLLLNDKSRARLAALLGTAPTGLGVREDLKLEEQLVRLLGQWLLRPNEQVRRAAVAFEQQHLAHPEGAADGGSPRTWRGDCHVGVHLRVPMFEFELRQVVFVEAWW